MDKRKAVIVDISGLVTDTPDFPVAVIREKVEGETSAARDVVDPVFSDTVTKNLFGRIMTLVEATTETHKLRAVKDLFAKELRSWENDVYESAREIAGNGGSSSNLYTKYDIK